MIFKKFIANHKNLIFIIDEDLPEVGAVLYVCENKKVVRDWAQNSIQICKEQAFEEYGVSLLNWQEMKDFTDFPWLVD
jgi:hypothetical protein